jgi:hypothetical protein
VKGLTVKKLLVALIVGVLMLSIVGCSSGNEKSSTGEQEPVTIRFSFDLGVGEPILVRPYGKKAHLHS